MRRNTCARALHTPYVGVFGDRYRPRETRVGGHARVAVNLFEVGAHLKDFVPAGSGRRQVEALAKAGYRAFYSFEWEKRWHPDIQESEIAIVQYAQVASDYLRRAGVRELSAHHDDERSGSRAPPS